METNKESNKLSRRTKILIRDAINDLPEEKKNNRYAICEHIAEDLCNAHAGDSLEYQSKRMGLGTTGQILAKIDAFFVANAKTRKRR